MIGPAVFARTKQRNHRSSVRIDARQVGSFVRVASIACECETRGIIGTTMLLRQDVFQVEGNQWRCGLVKAAIFTRVPGPVANQIASSLVQSGSLTGEEAARLCLHYGNDVDGLDKVLVLGIFSGRERPLICLPAQLRDSRLHVRICTKVEKCGCGFVRQGVR